MAAFFGLGGHPLVLLAATALTSLACQASASGAGVSSPQEADPLAPAFQAFLEGEELMEGKGRQPAAALAAYERAAALQPEVEWFQLRRDGAMATLRDQEEDLARTDEALARRPNEAGLYCQRAAKLAFMGRADEKIEAVRRCAELDPSPNQFRSLGEALLEAGRYAEALGAFDEGLARPPRAGDAPTFVRQQQEGLRYGRGRAFLRAGERERALADFGAVVARERSLNLDALAYRGLTFQQLERQAEAQEAYDLYRRAWPSGDAERQAGSRVAEAGLALGAFFLREGLPEAGLEAIDDPRTGPLVRTLIGRGEILLALGRYEEALAAFTEAAEVADEPISGLLEGRARALAYVGRYGESLAAYAELRAYLEEEKRQQEEQERRDREQGIPRGK